MLRRLVREPFVHFLLLGAAIFGAHAWTVRDRPPDDLIVVDQPQLDHLKELWALQWKRSPAPDDVAALVDRHVRQEVFYREALRLGLDRNDEIVKKRLAQKMEAVASDLSTLMQPPTDAQLREYFASHRDLFTMPVGYAFTQVLFPADDEPGTSPITTTLAALRGGAALPADRRNALAVPNDWPLTSVTDIDNAFGGTFASSLEALPVGSWAGPVRSGLGWHLVRVDRRRGPTTPAFEDVRSEVAREYTYRSTLDAQDRLYQELRRKYRVEIAARDVPLSVRADLSPR